MKNITNIETILSIAIKGNASDIILKAGSVPKFRYNGTLVNLSGANPLDEKIIRTWLETIIPPYLKSSVDKIPPEELDFAYQSTSGYRFRVNAFKQKQTYSMVFRIIPNHIRTIEELQLPLILNKIIEEKRGLILVTGATGSGKTTTLAAMIQKINLEQAIHIITIEDPIEYLFQDIKATITQREIGIDAKDFASALRSALRQNPDIILVGELRDKDTIETALMAAETGHLVLSTLHTSNAIESINRILSYFPENKHTFIRKLLAENLKAICSQRLVLRKDSQGLIAAPEIMIPTGKIKECILTNGGNEIIYESIRQGKSEGMISFDDSLFYLYSKGIISKDTAILNATNKEDFKLKLSGVNPNF